MSYITDMLNSSGVTDLFVFACFSFYVTSRLIRQDWGDETSNDFKAFISGVFCVFGIFLLIMTLFQIGDYKKERNHPQVQQQHIKQPNTIPDREGIVPEYQKDDFKG